jgi:branched-chain amino acid transport system permease protein
MSATAAPPPVTVHRWTLASRSFVAFCVGLVVLLAVVPYLFSQNTTEKLTELFVLIILASMWNVLAGFGGMVSIGQQAFIGIGAYATIVFNQHGISPYVAVVIAALFAGVLSLPISLLVFRLRGGQFAVGMWVIAEIFRLLVTNTQSLGGGTGKTLSALNVYDPATRQANTYWIALAFTVGLLVTSFVLLRSRTGAALQAIRDDEGAAESVGVRVTRAKRLVFVLAAVGCGAAGSITLANLLSVQANGAFSIQYTALMIFMVLVGGLGTFEGPVLGAFILFGIQQQFADQGSWYLVGLGVVAILVTLLFPRGLWGALVDRFNIRLVPVGYHLRGLPTTTEQLRAATATKPPPTPE